MTWEEEIIRCGFSDDMPLRGGFDGGLGGRMGENCEDFQVTEIPAYDPAGSGEHLYLTIRKIGRNTMDVVKDLTEIFSVSDKVVGYAGLKDRNAVTTQRFSVAYSAKEDAGALLKEVENRGYAICDVNRHNNKIRVGHLKGNRFVIRLVDVEGTLEQGRELSNDLARNGFLNYFGHQRFGYGRSNFEQALKRLERGVRGRKVRDGAFDISVIQSAIFNLALAYRETRCGSEIYAGDVMRKVGGGCFVCEDPVSDAPRLASGEIVPTSALPGKKVMFGYGRGLEIEQEAAAAFGFCWPEGQNETLKNLSAFSRFAEGTRRECLARLGDVSIESAGERAMRVAFSLPPGCYATMALRHLCGRPAQRQTDEVC